MSKDVGVVKDLIILLADRDMEAAVRGVLARAPNSWAVRPDIQWDVRTHPRHNPGCRTEGAEYLNASAESYRHAILMFDYEGCGGETAAPVALAAEVLKQLRPIWQSRCRVIVINPELEAWVWSSSPHVGTILGWDKAKMPLKSWLIAKDYWREGDPKPHRPKEAMDAVLKASRTIHSSSLYKQLAANVGFANCTDRSFLRLKKAMQKWFSDAA